MRLSRVGVEWELHQLCALGLGAEPFLGADEDPAKFGQLIESQLGDIGGKFVLDSAIPRETLAKRPESNPEES